MFVVDHGEAGAAATMKSPVRAARSRSGRTAGRHGPASQELFSEECPDKCTTLPALGFDNYLCSCVPEHFDSRTLSTDRTISSIATSGAFPSLLIPHIAVVAE